VQTVSKSLYAESAARAVGSDRRPASPPTGSRKTQRRVATVAADRPEGEVGHHPRNRIPQAVWDRPDMRRHLAARDVAAVFRLLQRFGVSQRAIAARTGQSQSEISEIISGKRQVFRYDLLLRIAEGLGVPRGWMGLAYDDSGQAALEPRTGDRP
jgi:predicted XRE-type DNA-binding protein